MKFKFIFAIVLLALILLAMGRCVIRGLKEFTNFPEYAKREVAYAKHKDVMDQLNAILVKTNSLAEAQQQTAAATWPEKVVFIHLKEDGAKDGGVDAFKRYAWTSSSTLALNGSGHGTLGTSKGDVKIVIINNSQLNAAGKKIKYDIYLEHREAAAGAPAAPASEAK
jgi:hypothetical protein